MHFVIYRSFEHHCLQITKIKLKIAKKNPQNKQTKKDPFNNKNLSLNPPLVLVSQVSGAEGEREQQ